MPVIPKPKDEGPLFGGKTMVIFGKAPMKQRKTRTETDVKIEATDD